MDAGWCGRAPLLAVAGGVLVPIAVQTAFLAPLSTALMVRMAAHVIGVPILIPAGAIATERVVTCAAIGLVLARHFDAVLRDRQFKSA